MLRISPRLNKKSKTFNWAGGVNIPPQYDHLTYPRGIGFTFHRAGGAGGVNLRSATLEARGDRLRAEGKGQKECCA